VRAHDAALNYSTFVRQAHEDAWALEATEAAAAAAAAVEGGAGDPEAAGAAVLLARRRGAGDERSGLGARLTAQDLKPMEDW
jgi:hypothetical protein